MICYSITLLKCGEKHTKDMLFFMVDLGYPKKKEKTCFAYPLVMTKIAIEAMAIYSSFTHLKRQFSIVCCLPEGSCMFTRG